VAGITALSVSSNLTDWLTVARPREETTLLALFRADILARGYFIYPAIVLRRNHPPGKPADDSPGCEPYNEIDQIHFLSPLNFHF